MSTETEGSVTTQVEETGTADDVEESRESDPSLGDAGKKALDQERQARKAAERKLRQSEAALAKATTDAMSEQEKAIETARLEGEEQARSVAAGHLVRSQAETEAVAAGVDPARVSTFLRLADFDSVEVDQDWKVDREAVQEIIGVLLDEVPEFKSSPKGPATGPQRGKLDGGAQPPTKVSGLDAGRQIARQKLGLDKTTTT